MWYAVGMKHDDPPVWECEHEIVVNAGPEPIWRLLQDVQGWPQWNRGIERIEIRGPFAVGTHIVMISPGQPALTTRLVEVRENAGFVDETRVGDLRVFVDHRLESIDADRTRVVYSLEAFGASCETVGPMIAADFPDVLNALALRAEALACETV